MAASLTPAERKALLFFALLALLGGSARGIAGAGSDVRGPTAADSALAAQLARVDSARDQQRERRGPRRGRAARPAAKRGRDSAVMVDVNRASAAELEALPRIGPTLARRIVQERDEGGLFASVEDLQRVKGIGPKLVTLLAAHVTFSGAGRPSTALSVSRGSARSGSRSHRGATEGRRHP